MMFRHLILGVFVCAVLSGCGGGSTGTVLPQTSSLPTAGSGSSHAASSIVIAIKIPAGTSKSTALKRQPLYVSQNTESASISVNGGPPVVANLTAGSPNCVAVSGGGRTCTVSVTAPIGVDTFDETLYSGANATGNQLSQGTTTATIASGQANTVVLTLDGIIASLSMALSNATPPVGAAANIGLTVNFLDASGASIIGGEPFVTPVTLTDSDASGATTLSKTKLNSPADAAALSIAYTGAALSQAVIGATAGSVAAPSVTLLPKAIAPIGFNDYVTFGYDNGRQVFNPNSTAFTPASISKIHLAWQAPLGGGDFNSWTQPTLATEIAGHKGVLFVGGGSGRVYGYDALTGSELWSHSTGQETYTCEGGNNIVFGIGGTAAYDPGSKSIYVMGNTNAAANALGTNTLYHLDAASGAVLGQVDVAPRDGNWPSLDFSHTSVALGSNGLAYVGTGATCDISSWRGRVVAVNVPSMTIANTFFTVWDPQNTRGAGSQPWGGGGIWGWGGVSLDSNNFVFTGVGNTDNGSTNNGAIVSPFQASPAENSGYGEAFLELRPDISAVQTGNHPIPSSMYSGVSEDLDLQGTPVLFQPNGAGCDPMAALQGKSGTIYLYDRTQIGNGPVKQYQLAPSTYADGFLGGPAYSPATGLLYVAVTSSNESLFPPGMVAIDPGCGHPSITWHAQFGPDAYSGGSAVKPGVARSVPAVSAGGVVFVGTACTPAGDSCSATADATTKRSAQGAVRKPLICCAPSGTGGGAVWALDAATGEVLNNGNPLIITNGPLRMPPTIDGNWMFVLDNSGNLYALTLDSTAAAINTTRRAVDSRMLQRWEPPPSQK